MDNERQKGALTVEAAIYLMFFIVFFVSFINLVNVVRAQILIQNGVIQTAKELSQYSYILTKVGLVESSNNNQRKVKEVRSDVNSVANDVTQISSAISEIAATGDIESNMQTIIDSANSASDTLGGYLENPESILAAVLAVGRDRVESAAKTFIIGKIARMRLKTNLSAGGQDADAMLKKLGIENGLDGLDFTESKWFDDENQDIRLVCSYRIKVKYMFLEMQLPKLTVCAATRIW